MQLFLIHNFVPSQKLPCPHWDKWGTNGDHFVLMLSHLRWLPEWDLGVDCYVTLVEGNGFSF